MKIPRMAHEAIVRTLRDSINPELEAEAAGLGYEQTEESRVIIRRLIYVLEGAAEADEHYLTLNINLLTNDDVSCLLGVVTGLFLSHKELNRMMLDNGDMGSAMEVATVGRAIGIAGKRIIDAHKARMAACMN